MYQVAVYESEEFAAIVPRSVAQLRSLKQACRYRRGCQQLGHYMVVAALLVDCALPAVVAGHIHPALLLADYIPPAEDDESSYTKYKQERLTQQHHPQLHR